MRSALYYPHTSVASTDLVKTALLLWDKLEYIVPRADFDQRYGDPTIARAMDIVGAARVPSDKEKKETHLHIEKLAEHSLPLSFYYGIDDGPRRYEIYPQKLLPETWDLLRRSRLAGGLLENFDYPTTEPIGLAIMSILADCCAGATRSRVTDRGAAYATLASVLSGSAGMQTKEPAMTHELLVPISLRLLDARSMSLRRLIEFREREERENGHTLRNLRHRYVDNLEKYIKRMTTEQATASDAAILAREYEDDMKSDLDDLKAELGFAKREAALSKDVLVSAIAAMGTVAAWTTGLSQQLLDAVSTLGAPATVGGLLSAGNKYLATRRSILQRHPMAYIYELKTLPNRDFHRLQDWVIGGRRRRR